MSEFQKRKQADWNAGLVRKTFKDMVKQELREMSKAGVKVPARAFDMVDLVAAETEYMSVTEAADLCIEMTGV